MGVEDTMSDNEQTSIDLSVNADAAVETMKELAAAALKADDAFQQLKQHQVELANAIPGNRPVSTYNEAAARFQQMDPSLIRDTYPAVAQTQNAITAQATNVRTQAMDFVGTNPQAAGQPASALLGQFQQFMAQQQQAQQASAGVNYQAPPPPPGQEGLRYGPAVPPEMDRLARYGYDKAQSMDARDAAKQQGALGGDVGTDTTQQDRSATQLGDKFAQALTRSAGGLMAGGISGAANAAGMGATGDILSGLARPLMSMLGEFAAPLAAGVAVGGAALGIGDLQAHYAGDRQSLAGSVGTTTGATPGSELSTAMNTGWAFDYKESESAAAAKQLGLAGVDSSQLGGALNASMALARVGNIGLGEATNLTGSLMQGGQSSTQVATTYSQLDDAARVSGVSLGRLVEGIKALNQAAGVGQISVNSLAAAQAMAGTSVNVAQAISGTVGSTGTSALSQAAMLGLNPAQFEQAQKSPAALMDAYAGLAKRYDIGSGGVQIAQQALSSAGFDFSGMSGAQSDTFIRKLVGEGPGAAQKFEQSLQRKEAAPGATGPQGADAFIAAGKQVANDITGPTGKFAIAVDQGAAALGNAAGTINQVLGKYDPRYNSTGTDLSAGPNPHHIQPTRPLQGDSTVIMGPPSPYDLGIKIDGSGPVTPTALARQAHATQLAIDAHNQTIQQAALANNQVVDASKIGFDASGDSRFGPISGTAVNQGMAGQLKIGGASLSASTFAALQSAAQRTGVPLSVLLAQSRQEATVNGKIDSSARSADGGIGLGQFTDAGAAVQYLGQASHELGMGAVTASNWRQMALNPRLAAQGMADYDAANLASKASGGRWDKALSQYNAGPGGWDVTGKPGQGRDYGTGITSSAEQVQHTLGITVTVQDQNGNKVGQTKTQHNINTSKKVVAAQSYGPTGDTSPTVGMPLQLPAHFK